MTRPLMGLGPHHQGYDAGMGYSGHHFPQNYVMASRFTSTTHETLHSVSYLHGVSDQTLGFLRENPVPCEKAGQQ